MNNSLNHNDLIETPEGEAKIKRFKRSTNAFDYKGREIFTFPSYYQPGDFIDTNIGTFHDSKVKKIIEEKETKNNTKEQEPISIDYKKEKLKNIEATKFNKMNLFLISFLFLLIGCLFVSPIILYFYFNNFYYLFLYIFVWFPILLLLLLIRKINRKEKNKNYESGKI